MTNEEIQKHIEQNCRNEYGEPMMDEQAFYEGAKWMRDKALTIPAVVGRSEQLVCPNCDGEGFSGKGTNEILPCLSCFGSGERAD